METMFENCDFWFDKLDEEDDRPFMVACKDRETKNGERWVLASLSIEEATTLYNFLQQHLEKRES